MLKQNMCGLLLIYISIFTSIFLTQFVFDTLFSLLMFTDETYSETPVCQMKWRLKDIDYSLIPAVCMDAAWTGCRRVPALKLTASS